MAARTMASIVSPMPRSKVKTASRRSAAIVSRPRPQAIANTTTGSSRLSAAALIGLAGTMPSIQSRRPGTLAGGTRALVVPRIDATVAASTCSQANIGGTATRLMMANVISSVRNVASVRRPTERTLWRSVDAAIPTISNEPTSGMTVIRMTLTHSVPIGSITATRVRSDVAG